MFSGYTRALAKRSWWVPSFVVWGLPSWEEAEFLAVEEANGDDSIYFGSIEIGDASQSVSFDALADHRGNALPGNITKPLVLIRSRSEASVFLVEQESNTGFKIARESSAVEPAVADLLIIEMGE